MPARNAVRKLTASPNFALCFAADGSAFVVGEVEPYPQYWLAERERLLFALFGRKGGLDVDKGVAAMLALRPGKDPAAERKRIEIAISGMVEAGVLISPSGELSRYGKAMASDYMRHRPFPLDIVDAISEEVGVGPQTRVLDLASGPGSLALELARRTPHVSIMELSRGFVSAATEEARRRGVALEAINESCNRLPQHDGSYDLVTISQALHWLDDLAVCRGVCRTLAPGGSFMVIHAALNVPDPHPLSWVLGDRTPLGDKVHAPFAEQVRPLFRRLALLFAALDAPDVERHDPSHARKNGGRIASAGITLHHQPRPIDEGFARAFLSDSHIAAFGQDPDEFWAELTSRCAGAAPDDMIGGMDWAVLHFRRGATGFDIDGWVPSTPRAVAFP